MRAARPPRARWRVERGLSQEALDVVADVDRSYVSGIERSTFYPTVEMLERLTVALAVDIAALFVLPGQGEAPPTPLRGAT